MENLKDIEKLFEWQIVFSKPITQEQIDKLYNPFYYDNYSILPGDTVLKFICDDEILYSSREKLNKIDFDLLKYDSAGYIPSFLKNNITSIKLESLLRVEFKKIEEMLFYEYDRYYGDLTMTLCNYDYASYVEDTLKSIKNKLFFVDLSCTKEIMKNTIPITILYDFKIKYDYNDIRREIAIRSGTKIEILELLDKNKDYLNSNTYVVSEIKKNKTVNYYNKTLI